MSQNPISAPSPAAAAVDDLADEALRAVLQRISAVNRRMLTISQPYAAEHDLAPRGLWILGRIREGIVHPGDLAREFNVGPSLVTAETQRLIAAGLVTSEADPKDARRSRLAVTPLGEALYERMWADLRGAVGRTLAQHPADERAVFLKLLAALAD